MPRKKKVDIESESLSKEVSQLEMINNSDDKILDILNNKISVFNSEFEKKKEDFMTSLVIANDKNSEIIQETIKKSTCDLEIHITESIDSKISNIQNKLNDDIDKSIFALENLVEEKLKNNPQEKSELDSVQNSIQVLVKDFETQLQNTNDFQEKKIKNAIQIVKEDVSSTIEKLRKELVSAVENEVRCIRNDFESRIQTQNDSDTLVRDELQSFKEEIASTVQTIRKELVLTIENEVRDIKNDFESQVQTQNDSDTLARDELQSFKEEIASTVQTIRKELVSAIENEVRDIKNDFERKILISNNDFENKIQNEIQTIKNDTTQNVRTLKSNDLKNIEDKIYHLSDYNTRLTLQNSSFEQKISGLLEKIKIYELEAEDRMNQVIKNIDQLIKKKMTEYNNRIISEKAEFEAILTQNTDVLEQFKNDSSFLEYLKSEIKNDLRESIEEYNKNIHYLLRNKSLQNELKRIDFHTTNILNNTMTHSDNILLLKKLKNALDNSIMNK